MFKTSRHFLKFYLCFLKENPIKKMMTYKILGVLILKVLLSCTPLHLVEDLESQSQSEALYFQEETGQIEIGDYKGRDLYNLEEYEVNNQSAFMADQRNRTAFNFLTNQYLETRQERQEFNRLYNKFKNESKLRDSQIALKRVLAFYVKHKDGPVQCPEMQDKRIKNQDRILLVDYTIPHPQDRFFKLNLKSGEVSSSPVAHGHGSNKNCPAEFRINCGRRSKCLIPSFLSNTPGSGASSRGFYLTDYLYRSKQRNFSLGSPRSRKGPNALVLEGLNYGVNHKARERGIVFHRASYYKNLCSSSAGCPAIKPSVFEDLKRMVDGGALMYLHTIEDEQREQPDC